MAQELSSEKDAVWTLLAAASSGAIVVLESWGLLWVLTHSSLPAVYLLMATIVGLLVTSMIAFHRRLFPTRTFFVCSMAAVVTVLVVWSWQRIAFRMLVPNGFLEYGYFLSAAGKHVRVWLVEVPFVAGSALMILLMVSAVISAWRCGARWRCAVIPLWWFALFAVFVLPSLNWSVQGDASVFI